MRKYVIVALACSLSGYALSAQELFVFSEPASTMPARSVSARIGYRAAEATATNKYVQRFTPGVMAGLSKSWMLDISGTFSNFYSESLQWESVKAATQYRFFSNDDVHTHFRMAAFADASYSRSPFYYGDINVNGDNSAVQAGLIATKLINKLAISATVSGIRAFATREEHVQQLGHSIDALYYSLSAGYLLLPLRYTDYKQTNLNLYLEMIGMQGLEHGDHMLDIAPALQLIFDSNLKLNMGARLQASGNMDRIATRNYFVSVERTFLGALPKHTKRSQ